MVLRLSSFSPGLPSAIRFGQRPAGQLPPALGRDHVQFGFHGKLDGPTSNLGPLFMAAVAAAIPQASRSDLAAGLKAASYVLDNGGNQTEAIAALRLAAQIDGQDMALYRKAKNVFERLDAGKPVASLSPPMQRIVLSCLLAEANRTGGSSIDCEQKLLQLGGLKDNPLQHELRRTLARPKLSELPAQPDRSLNAKRFSDALALTVNLHDGQIRKDTHGPYAIHPLHVAATVLEHGGSEDAAIAALLHDSLEDQGDKIDAAEIRRRFGDRVADMVQDCTIPLGQSWWDAKSGHLMDMQHLRNPESGMIMASDLMHNTRTLLRTWHEQGDKVWKNFVGQRDAQLWYDHSMLSALKKALGGNPPILQELAHSIEALETATGGISATERRRQDKEAAWTMAREQAKDPLFQLLNHVVYSLPSTFPKEVVMQGNQLVPDFTPERSRQHEKFIQIELQRFEKSLKGKTPPKEKVIHIVTGPLGAGKSTRIVKELAARDQAYILDADNIKRYIKGYHVSPMDPDVRNLKLSMKNGLGATAIHRESSYIAGRLMDHLVLDGRNVVLSFTGTDLEGDKALIGDFKRLGYKVYVHHVEVPLTLALKRVVQRFFDSGRYAPPEETIRKSAVSTDNFIKLKEWGRDTGMLDGYTWVNNNVAPSELPIPIETYNFPPMQAEAHIPDAPRVAS